MDAWENLTSSSTIESGDAWEHLIAQGGGEIVYKTITELADSFTLETTDMTDYIIEIEDETVLEVEDSSYTLTLEKLDYEVEVTS